MALGLDGREQQQRRRSDQLLLLLARDGTTEHDRAVQTSGETPSLTLDFLALPLSGKREPRVRNLLEHELGRLDAVDHTLSTSEVAQEQHVAGITRDRRPTRIWRPVGYDGNALLRYEPSEHAS